MDRSIGVAVLTLDTQCAIHVVGTAPTWNGDLNFSKWGLNGDLKSIYEKNIHRVCHHLVHSVCAIISE